tara:strand:+ start:446 stop:613 length:168 start_codon:yes stop_codon:yes gene_type:complete
VKLQPHQSQELVVEVEQEMMLQQVVQEDLVAVELEVVILLLLEMDHLTLEVVEVD